MGKLAGLTAKEIAALKPREEAYEVRDAAASGGYVVVFPSGAVSYVLRYRFAGKKVKHTVGKFDPTAKGGLATVRAAALKALADLAQARAAASDALLDPASAKRAARPAKARATLEAVRETKVGRADAVENVVAEFAARHLCKLRTGREVARVLNREVVPRWKGRALAEIGRADIHALLDSIVDRGSPIAANRLRAYLNKFFNWAMSRGYVDRNPCDAIERPAEEYKRERLLDDRELSLIWRAAARVGWPFGEIVRLLILTGQRKSEIAGGRWGEIDLGARVWSLPAARVKNKRSHAVPLSYQAVALIERLPRLDGAEVIFTTTGVSAVSGFTRWKAKLDGTIAELNGGAPIAPWGLHDLRHAVAVGMQRLGVAPHVIEKVLNHVSGTFGGIAGVYQRHEYEAEKREALERWAAHVDRIAVVE